MNLWSVALPAVRWGTLLFCAGLVLACQQGETDTSGPDASTVVPVATSRVQTGTLVRRLGYVGDIEGEAEIRVFSSIPDRIISLPVKEGDRVKKGQILGVVKSKTLTLGLQQAASGLDAARAQTAALEDQVARLNKLKGSGAVTSSQLLNTESQLAAARAQVRQLEATLGQARQRRGDAVIKAPIAGIIGQVFMKVGDLAVPQIPICTVVDMDKVRIKARVPESDLPSLEQGQPVEIRVAVSEGPPLMGSVSRVSPVLDRLSRTAIMEIDVDNAAHALKPGMLARLQVEVDRREGAAWVPKDAVTVTSERKGDTNLYRAVIVKAGKAEVRQVLLGLQDGIRVEVLEGIQAGELLAIQGQHLVADGDPVRVQTAEPSKDSPGAEKAKAPDTGQTGAAAGGEKPTERRGG